MYNSPIRIITSDLGMKVTEALDEQIYQSVLNVGIDVDKGELLRALQYDRNQYAKGYADAKAELLRCKDCKQWSRNSGIAESPNGHCFYHDIDTNGYDFCSYGERRTDE